MGIDCEKSIKEGVCSAECCGNIPLSKDLIIKHLDKIQVDIKKDIEEKFDLGNELFYVTKDNRCIFLNRTTKRCEIYEYRPEVCHIFGSGIDKDGQENVLLYCPYFKPNGNIWSVAKSKHLQRRINQVFKETIKKRK